MNNFLNQRGVSNIHECDAVIWGIDYCSSVELTGVERGADFIRKASQRYANSDGSDQPIKIYNPSRGYILDNIIIRDGGNLKIGQLENISWDSFNIFLGGDHAVTYYILNNKYLRRGKITVLHFDAHGDFLDEFDTCPHGSVMRKVSQLNHIDKIVHIGLRGNLNTGPGLEQSVREGNTIITAEEIDISRIMKAINTRKVYISIDTDFFEPSIAPATNNLEPGGIFYQEFLLHISTIMKNFNVIGIDFVEFNPVLDINGITANLLANVVCDCISFKHK